MSCCSSGYCKFNFPEGPPLTDVPVSSLGAKYLFLPYGTLLSEGEVVRIWMENGQTRVVSISRKLNVTFDETTGIDLMTGENFLPVEWVALDSGLEVDTLVNWHLHPLCNPEAHPVVLVFQQPEVPNKSLKQILLSWLYKIRTL